MAAVVILAVAQVLAKMTWQLWPTGLVLEVPVRALPDSQQVKGKGPGLTEQLALAAPFGRAAKRSKPAPVKVVVPETRLDLELKGVIAGKDGKTGGAIIADKKEGDRYFAIGASLPGGVLLDEVYPERVVLLRNGRQEVLKLTKVSLEESVAKGRGTPPARRTQASRRSAGPGVSRGYSKTSKPSGMNRAIRIRPLFRGGKIKGFRISPGRDRKLFSKLGFKAGDLLVRINGRAPQSPNEIFSVLDDLQNGGGVTVEVTRRGRPVTLTLGE